MNQSLPVLAVCLSFLLSGAPSRAADFAELDPAVKCVAETGRLNQERTELVRSFRGTTCYGKGDMKRENQLSDQLTRYFDGVKKYKNGEAIPAKAKALVAMACNQILPLEKQLFSYYQKMKETCHAVGTGAVSENRTSPKAPGTAPSQGTTSLGRTGNVTTGADGTTYTRTGNVITGSNGTTYTDNGSVITGSDGTTFTRTGNVITGPDGRFCVESPSVITCN